MPVIFSQLPANKVMTFASDSILKVEVKGQGSSLFNMLYLKKASPVYIDLRFLPLNLKEDLYQGIVTPSLLTSEIGQEQNLLGKIVSISPDTIYLSFEDEKSRRLPVDAIFDLTFEKQYMKYGNIVFDPDTVMVRGPGRIVDNMESASLGHISLNELSRNYIGSSTFRKDSSNPNLVFLPKEASYTIPVEKFTETEFDVTVKIINTEGLKIKSFPDKVKITFTVALKDYPKVEPGMIRAVADYSSVSTSGSNNIKVLVDEFPSFIRINKIEPEKVEYIIIK
jgi:hypothetical protein